MLGQETVWSDRLKMPLTGSKIRKKSLLYQSAALVYGQKYDNYIAITTLRKYRITAMLITIHTTADICVL